MAFQVAQRTIADLLREARSGALQLPDFQRQYRWDDERITELLITLTRGHPMGVLMLLETTGPATSTAVRFKPTPLAGIDPTRVGDAEILLLDGQQRVTSLVQALSGDGVVDTVNGRGHKMTRRYYLDIEAAADPDGDPRELIVSVPGDGVVKAAHAQRAAYEVTSPEGQVAAGLMPLTAIFRPGGPGEWLRRWAWATGDDGVDSRFDRVDGVIERIVTPAQDYQIPAIVLDAGTGREAVATVFEKVNTGGLPLDVFELLTATFAADTSYHREFGTDFRLGDDWQLTRQVLDDHPVLTEIRRTDVLQAVTLLATLEARRTHTGPGRPPAISARREDVLGLDLAAYLRWAPALREALAWAAGFLHDQHIHSSALLPYRSQLIALAVVRVVIGPSIDRAPVLRRVRQWFWCGVFAELYGGSVETRLVRDVEQVPAWALAPLALDASEPRAPDAVTARLAAPSRLAAVQSRGSALYRGVVALVLGAGALDWADGISLDVEASEQRHPDVRHVFSRAWCVEHGIDAGRRDSVVNKVPVSARTASLLGTAAPSAALADLELRTGRPAGALDGVVATHAVDPRTLRTDDFDAFFAMRLRALVTLVEQVTARISAPSGRPVARPRLERVH